MNRYNQWLDRLSPRTRKWFGWLLVLGGLIGLFARSRYGLPLGGGFLLWFIPFNLGGWALMRDYAKREQKELPPQRRMDGTYEDAPRDQ